VADNQIVAVLLENLQQYCKAIKAAGIDASADRKKVFVLGKQHSHADEIEERLAFMR
jgi:hypothetical protein